MQSLHRLAAGLVVSWLTVGVFGQPSSPNVAIQLERLANTGSVLMIAAHPDDEHTALLAYLALGRKLRTGYLSLTRGEGGQNVIGPEKGALLGAIRTQELLAARRIDGAEQFFTSAVDFGYSKTASETLQKWDRPRVVGDIVRVLREFQPDVVILRWTGTDADGHGQHQASNILALEAIASAKDKAKYPEQHLQPWAASRVFVFRRSGGTVSIDTGAYDPMLGYSFTELAAISRSEHQSQAMGAARTVGAARINLDAVGGGGSRGADFLDGISTGPERLGPQFASLLTKAISNFEPRRPYQTIPILLEARRTLRSSQSNAAIRKVRELDELVGQCAGMLLQAAVERPYGQVGADLPVRMEVINRSPAAIRLESIRLEGAEPIGTVELPENVLIRKPLKWRVQDPPPLASFRLVAGGETLEIRRPLVYRYVDDMLGDRTQPFVITPPVSVTFADSAVLFRDASPREVPVRIQSYAGAVQGTAALDLPPGWSSQPREQSFKIDKDAGAATVRFVVTPSKQPSVAEVHARAMVGAVQSTSSVVVIRYPHIPTQIVSQPAAARFTRADVRVLAKTVGYIPGAGDEVPAALRQLGCDIKLISADELSTGSLDRYDAIVTGVRAFNVRTDLPSNIARLNDYVHRGGTLVVQYNTAENTLGQLGPFPMKIGRGRVAVEEAPVQIRQPHSEVLRTPNAISSGDFDGWVQERGLYFPSEWDPKLQPVISSADPGEPLQAGGILVGRYGKGAYVYTSYSWFRQLPAGVPGAFRLFANLLSQ